MKHYVDPWFKEAQSGLQACIKTLLFKVFIPKMFVIKALIQVPVVDGYSFPHLTKRMNVAGRHITSYLVDLLSRRG